MLDQHPEPARFVRLASVGDMTAAQVLAAKLRSEGIEVRIHSQAFGPYPMTVGQMAESELWVLTPQLEEASRILLDAEVIDALSAADRDGDTPPAGMPYEMRVVAIAVVVILAVLFVLRYVFVY